MSAQKVIEKSPPKPLIPSEKDLFDQYQSLLHIDDKTKADAFSLFTQFSSKQDLSLVFFHIAF